MAREIGVAKFGSGLVKNEAGIDVDAIEGYAAGLAATYKDSGLIVVTSGAVAAGRHRAEKFYGDSTDKILTQQQLAALGGTAIFSAWEQAFELHDVLAASVAITHRQLAAKRFRQKLFNREEKQTFAKILEDNANDGIVTVINEADAISVVELMELASGGDNDGLASHVAISVGATSLTIFTKKGGVFDNEDSLIEVVDQNNIAEVRQLSDPRTNGEDGRGGLRTKVDAAWAAGEAGIEVKIAAVNYNMTGTQVTRFVVG